MAKLTKTQLILLHVGAADPDGIIDRSQIKDRSPAALSAALGALKRKGLAAKTDDSRWRMTAAGRDTIGTEGAADAAEAIKAATPRPVGETTRSAKNVGAKQRPGATNC